MSSGEWWRVAVVATLGVGIGVAIAGMPDAVPAARVAAAPSTTAAPTTAPPIITAVPSTTVGASSTTVAVTTTTVAPPATRVGTRVVVGNAGSRNGLAAAGEAALVAAGYTFVVVGDAAEQRAASVVLYASGREREARRLAADLGLAATAIEPLVGQPIADVDVRGADLVALLANDVVL